MKENSEIDEEEIARVIQRHYPSVQAIYLFGSRATGDAWPTSDVDLALLLPPVQAKTEGTLVLSACADELARAVKNEVDFVNLRLASTVFQHEVIHNSRLLLVVDQEVILAFEMSVLSAYQKLNEERREILEEFTKTKRAYNL